MKQAKQSRRARIRGSVKAPKPYSQRCSVRVTFSKNRMKGLWRAHGRYIARDSAAQDVASAGKGFDAETSNIDIPPKLNEWQASGDERLWRFIVSPEFGERLDLTKLTRDLMGRIESDTGRSLEWVAIAHFNTEHPHVHVALRGCDRADKEVRFERDYIRNGLRAFTEELCTRQLGFRTTIDAEYAQARETEQQHVTSLDRMIAKQAAEPSDNPDRFLFTLPELTERNRSTVQSLAVRANVLSRMGLAEPVDARSWSVRRDLESVLRAMKRGRDRQKTLRDHGAAISDDRLPFVTVDFRQMKMIQGRVLVHGEDESGRAYLLIEGTDAQVHHLPYAPEIQDARHRGQLRVNSFVRIQRLSVEGRPVLEVEDLGDAEALLKKRSYFVAEAPRIAGQRQSAKVWGGWLGRYNQALAAVSAALGSDDRRTTGKSRNISER
jgi:type IV secretory pathway VirD2 relaxase